LYDIQTNGLTAMYWLKIKFSFTQFTQYVWRFHSISYSRNQCIGKTVPKCKWKHQFVNVFASKFSFQLYCALNVYDIHFWIKSKTKTSEAIVRHDCVESHICQVLWTVNPLGEMLTMFVSVNMTWFEHKNDNLILWVSVSYLLFSLWKEQCYKHELRITLIVSLKCRINIDCIQHIAQISVILWILFVRNHHKIAQ